VHKGQATSQAYMKADREAKEMRRRAFITGGTGGIGQATTLLLAEKGIDVAFTYTSNEEKAQQLVSAVEERGGSCLAYRADVTRMEEIAAAAVDAGGRFGGIDYLVNNAGVLGKATLLLDIDETDWDHVLSVNLKGGFLTTKCILPYMMGREGACIVNVSSIAGKNGGTMGVHYAASKAGLLGFTFHLAQELLHLGVRANAVAPGPVDTGMLDDGTRERLRELSPMGRIAHPAEIAAAILFLLENRYVNGEVLDVNGGRYMD
jgi:3-oxoacyl-[acyl-carrier protein] reductase